MDPTLALLVTALGLAGIAGGAYAVFRTKGTRDTIDLLEQSVRIERTERLAEKQRCDERIASLQGQVDVLTNGLADALAHAVITRLDLRDERRG